MIEVVDCGKTYTGQSGSVQALDKVNLTVQTQEFVCVLGPSGCGKTTLLKLIAGIIAPDEGRVMLDGKVVTGPGPDCGMVFQNFALMPWADVLTNVAFGLELRGVSRQEREDIAVGLVKAVGLSGFERHYPRELSGGMQQRVGLARALAIGPAYLLMDEPFGSVDAQTRRALQEDLVRLHDANPATVVFVTHNMSEAVRLGDRIVLMSARPGRVQEVIDVPIPRRQSDDGAGEASRIELKEYLWSQLRDMQPGAHPED